MANDAKDITNPGLDLDDFIGLSFATFTDGKLYQLPDQQFANLYPFRYDWFQRPELKTAFKAKYGYDLGVPVNWSAYEDIADFFTNDVKEIDGQKVYGHMDYGKKDPSLGWRFTDAWLSMAGSGDRGLPNGRPVDEWSIRAENGIPVGASLSRGGDANGPAAVYACAKFVEWLKKYAPPEAAGMDFLEAGAAPGQGHIAQQIFWYSAVYPCVVRARAAGDECRRNTEMAHGPESSRRLLEGENEARLPGPGLLDDAEIRAFGANQGRLALRPVLRVEDHHAEKVRDLAAPDP
jgi:glycerol transport system substrate-binding protein